MMGRLEALEMYMDKRMPDVPVQGSSCLRQCRHALKMFGLALLVASTTPALIIAQTQAENGSSPYPTAPKWEPTPPPQPQPPVYASLTLPPRSFGSGSLKPFLRFSCQEVGLDGSRAPCKKDVIVREGHVFFFDKDWPIATPGDDTYLAVFGYQDRGDLLWRFGHNEGVHGGTERIESNISNEELQWMNHSSAFPSYLDCHCVEFSGNPFQTVGFPSGFDWSLGFEKALYHLLSMNIPPAEFFKRYSYDQARQEVLSRYAGVDGGRHLQRFLAILDEAHAAAEGGHTNGRGATQPSQSESDQRLDHYFSQPSKGSSAGAAQPGGPASQTTPRPEWLK
jgi:hypothetical protein